MNEILSVLVTNFEPIYLLDVVTPELDIIDLAFTIPLTPNIAKSGDSSEQISLDPCLISQDGIQRGCHFRLDLHMGGFAVPASGDLLFLLGIAGASPKGELSALPTELSWRGRTVPLAEKG